MSILKSIDVKVVFKLAMVLFKSITILNKTIQAPIGKPTVEIISTTSI